MYLLCHPSLSFIYAAGFWVKLHLVGKLASTVKNKVAFLIRVRAASGHFMASKENFLRKETSAHILRREAYTCPSAVSYRIVFPGRVFSVSGPGEQRFLAKGGSVFI